MRYVPSYKKLSMGPVADHVNIDAVKGQDNFKYADFFDARKNSCSYVKSIIDSIEPHVRGNHKYVLLDIKVRNLSVGSLPAYGFWHTDCTLDIQHVTKPEHHVIFVSGAGSRTEFVDSEIDLDLSGIALDKWSHSYENRIFSSIASSNGKTSKINECELYSYGRDLHRATPAMFAGPRILIRMTETDLVRPIKTRKS